ncbi:MAG: methyltransferase domain-containing protein [Candidatus Paceibacterota bacterium]
MNDIFLDKINIKEKILSGEKIILEFGGGNSKKAGRINLDILNLPETDIVFNLENGLPFLPDNSIDEIHATSSLEHIANFNFLMEEIYRVLKPNGILFAFVPHFSNPYFYSDPTHQRFFGLYTFSYFSKSHFPYRRKVPKFYNSCNFRIKKQKIIFHSKILEKIFNFRFRLQEIYEKYFSPFVPCYGLELTLEAVK